MSDGFLDRWSRRKLDAKQGKPLEPEPSVAPAPLPGVAIPEQTAPEPEDLAKALAEEVPPPTLEDVKALTPESDFSRFAANDVAAEVKNAAMKKLFSDPRYNAMDGMDVYTGDYSQPDPIEPVLMRQLVSAKFLQLFRQEELEQEEAARRPRDVADNAKSQTVAQSHAASGAAHEPLDHADPDLRLQQDDAAEGEDPRRGTG